MKDFTVDYELLKESLYGTEQEQAKARNTLKQLVESQEESEQDDFWIQFRGDQERADYFNGKDD